jgi:predicted DNA-binding ribbon-helix-helix protein
VSAIIKRSVNISGHMTSVSLEQEFWDALKAIAKARSRSVTELIVEIDAERDGGLSSAIRIYVLKAFQAESHSKSA